MEWKIIIKNPKWDHFIQNHWKMSKILIKKLRNSSDKNRQFCYFLQHKNHLLYFRRSFRTNIFQKERFNQNTVTIHFKASLGELLEKMKEAEPSFVRYVGQYVNVTMC
jgi:myosin heavy subunit